MTSYLTRTLGIALLLAMGSLAALGCHDTDKDTGHQVSSFGDPMEEASQ